jgi:hypothetical protein
MTRGTRARLLITAIIGCLLLATVPVASVSANTQSATTATPTAVVNALVGSGVSQVSNVVYSGNVAAIGVFSGFESAIAIDSGIVLSTGRADRVVGPNLNTVNNQTTTNVTEQTTGFSSTPSSNQDLEFRQATGLTNPNRTIYDRVSLSFNFVPNGDRVFFRYVFASEEYPEWVNSDFNDAFAFFINGQNCARVGSPLVPVSVNTINNTTNSSLFVNNVRTPTQQAPYNLFFDGFTKVLTCEAPVNPGVTNTIRLVIADVSDHSVDSAVFIRAGSFTTTPEVAIEDTSGYEGEAIDLIGTVTDPDSPNPTTTWEIASGGATCTIADPAALETTITCLDNTVVTVKLSADDGVSPVATASGTVTVLNAEPEVTITTPADGTHVRLVGAAVPVALTSSFTDAGELDTHACSIDWGDGNVSAVGAVVGSCNATHDYTTIGAFEIEVTITDKDGGVGSASVTVHVEANQAPDVAANSATVSVNEGQTATMGGTLSDPEGDSVQLSASIGTVVDNGDGTWSWSFATTDGPSQSQKVTITAQDEHGASASAEFDLVVNNVAPNVTIATPGEGQLFANNEAVALSASIVDPGVNDAVTCTIDWGNGVVSGPLAANVCAATHQYSAPGVYTITVTATDKDGDSDQATVMVVVYGEGSVTGGGWITSPAGAYAADPSLSGKATFGFTSQYKKGATVPTGNSQFQFQAGNLNVHAIAYDWLVVNQNSGNAQFKGTATVNGSATDANGNPYRFMIWAGDGSPDTFRIKVWSEGTGGEHVVYDNGVQQALGGGSVVIHKQK